MGSESLKTKISNSTYTSPRSLGGFQETPLLSSKGNLQLPDTTGTSNGTGFYCQMKLKKRDFWQQTLQIGFEQTGIKCTPCPFLNVLLDAIIFYWRFWTFCSDIWHLGFYQIPT